MQPTGITALRLLRRGWISAQKRPVRSKGGQVVREVKPYRWAIWAAEPEREPYPRPVAWGYSRTAKEAKEHGLMFMPAEAVLSDLSPDMVTAWFTLWAREWTVAKPEGRPDSDDFKSREEYWHALDDWYEEWSKVARWRCEREEARWGPPLAEYQRTSASESGRRRQRASASEATEEEFNGDGGRHLPCAAELKVLGLDPNSKVTADDIVRAFKRRAREVHPDHGGSHEAFINLKHARDVALRHAEVI